MDCKSFIPPDGFYTPTRVFHGTTNALAHIQDSMQAVLGNFEETMIVCLEDLLMFAKSE